MSETVETRVRRWTAKDWMRAATSLAGVAMCTSVGCSGDTGDLEDGEGEDVGVTEQALDTPGGCGEVCTGACGPNCDGAACVLSYRYVCEVDNNAQNTGYKRRIKRYVCGMHDGCRKHDACLSSCAANNGCGWGESACTIACHAAIVNEYGISNANSWRTGGGPFDSQQTFEYDDPGAKEYNPTDCPKPVSNGGSGEPPPQPPYCGPCCYWNGSSCQDACPVGTYCNGFMCQGP